MRKIKTTKQIYLTVESEEGMKKHEREKEVS
jgi:hypothetical protein